MALTETLREYLNPFREPSDDLMNLVTKVVMPNEVKEDLCNQRKIGRQLLEEFVEERIKSQSVNLWGPLKKRNLKTWNLSSKSVKTKTDLIIR